MNSATFISSIYYTKEKCKMKIYKDPICKYCISFMAILAIVETQWGHTYYVAIAVVALALMMLHEWWIYREDNSDDE